MESEDQFRTLYLKEEFDEVKDLLIENSGFIGYYPDFNRWLEKALEDASNGDRLVYALYKPVYNERQLNSKMVSVAIVKIAGESAELKCLFIDEVTKSNDYGRILYQQVEEQLARKGIGKIITDVPYENKELNWFLIQNGFQINGLIERYKKGNFDYILSKDVPMCYTGDPFDWHYLSKWFLENIYGFETSYIEGNAGESFQKYLLSISTQNRNGLMLPDIKGKAIVYDGNLSNADLQQMVDADDANNSFKVTIAHGFEDLSVDTLSEKNILCFDKKTIFEKCGCDEPLFEKEDINGIVLEVKKEHFENIPSDGGHFTYIKGPGSGRFARINNYVLFLVDSYQDSPFGAIMGYGKIKNISCADSESQWKVHKDLNPIFTDENYEQFTRHKKEVIAIVVEGFQEIEPILYNDFKEQFNEYFQEDYIGNVYVNEDFTTAFLLYLSQRQNSQQDIIAVEEAGSEEEQFELLLEKVTKIHDDFKKHDADVTLIKKDIEEIRINQKTGIKEDVVISVGLEAFGTGAQHQVTIPLQDIPYKDLEDELNRFFSDKSSGKYPKKVVDRIFKSLLEKKMSKE
ncbi:hypothetical protein V7O61_02485 [Methanolobus sp. WCC1]|uniref:hypothetical protein n=1 Tax=unclassified Methanolobus TaxID=2629569 RepID=UPI00325636D3